MTTRRHIELRREKLTAFRKEEAITADVATKFELREKIEALEAEIAKLEGATPGISPADKVWTVPHRRNPYFTAREDALTALDEALHKDGKAVLGQTQAISGLGGIGKTQTAVEYAYRHRADYQAILWTRGESRGDLVAGFGELAGVLGLAGKDAEAKVAAVRRWLQDNSSWLLVVDNADTPELLEPFLPAAPQGHILLTSRARRFGRLGIPTPLRLDTLPPEDARAFLLKRVGRDAPAPEEIEAAGALAAELGCLPLALEQAGAYVAARQARLEDYLAAYRHRRGKLLRRAEPEMGDHRDGVATTWVLNFEEVERASSAAGLVRPKPAG